MKKKILFLSFNDFQGGAAIASYNMMRSISRKEFYSELFCVVKKREDKNIKKIKISLLSYMKIILSILISQVLFFLFNSKIKIKRSLCVFNTGILKNINFKNVDIVHFQWFFNEFISLDEILSLNKRTVISLHDLWFCNGTYHYKPEKLNFFTKKFEDYFLKKKSEKILNSKNVIFTAPSEWCRQQFLNELKKRNLNKKKIPKIFVIKNVVDNKKKGNFEKNFYELKKIPPSEFITMFHFEKKNNYVKAYDLLFKFLKHINNNKKYKYFIIFGNNTDNFPYKKFQNIVFYNFGYVDNEKIDDLYKASDAFVLTSRQETFSQLTADSLINNTPVVAFNTSGHKELIIHKKNGYLVKNYVAKNLEKGLDYFNKNSFKKINYFKNLSGDKFYKKNLKKIYDSKNFNY